MALDLNRGINFICHMSRKQLIVGLLAIIMSAIGIAMVLAHEKTLLMHPKGIVAQNILELITANMIFMLLIIFPTYIYLLVVFWKYCIKKQNAKYDPDHTYGLKGELIMWVLPSIIVAVMAFVTWKATYELNPYKPLESDVKPLAVQVVAMDWKWLFIYPELGIATLNYLHIPENTPIHFRLTADGSPMNSFWIPQLSGQIYSMTGMSTQLHLMANGSGEYVGRAVEINGEGYAGMTFSVRSSSLDNFEAWLSEVRTSSLHLTEKVYEELVQRSVNQSILFFSEVENDLYQKIIHKYMYPTHSVL